MLPRSFDPVLVAVSVLVAILASYTALSLAERVTHAPGKAKAWWIAGGAFSMGTGIWSMHFVGMLAFRLPIPLGYDLGITALSWALPVGVSALALWQLSRTGVRRRELALSAVLIGIGINAMHYVGMSALQMQPGIVWEPALVAASVAIAVGAAGAALWLAFRLRHDSTPHVRLLRAGAALTMGFAIVGMHYTGMAAAAFPSGSVCGAAQGGFSLSQLAMVVIVATVSLLAIALLVAVYDARLAASFRVLEDAERTREERERLLQGERLARVDAERLSALKDEFLATLSHELRTPLNAMLGWVQVVKVKRDEATVARALETIERNARLQAQLIDDLLDMSRIMAGKVRLDLQMVDPAAVVATAVEALRPTAAAKDIELRLALDPRCGSIQADPARLHQVLWNLLSNALKFTQGPGHVAVVLRPDAAGVALDVADTGIGIAPDFLPHVFDRFRQADASTTRRHGGLGLGLAIVRQLVELHGGSVAARSAGEGHGATFTIRLPAEPAVAAEPPAPWQRARQAAAASGMAEAGDLRGVDVLVVDDEPDSLGLLEQVLRLAGATVRAAESAEAAWRLLRERAPDVLVSDIGMPGKDGYALVRELRSSTQARLATLPAIALTAFTRREDEQRALREGFSRYLPKPLDAAGLVRSVAALARAPAAAG